MMLKDVCATFPVAGVNIHRLHDGMNEKCQKVEQKGWKVEFLLFLLRNL